MALLTGTPCHPDLHLPALTHHRGHSSALALSTQGTPSPLLPPGPAPVQKHPPTCLRPEWDTPLAGPMWGLCTRTWQPSALSVPSTLLVLLCHQHDVPGPSHGTIVPLLGQLACRASPLERYELPCSATCFPHGPALAAFPGSHPGAACLGGLVAVQCHALAVSS